MKLANCLKDAKIEKGPLGWKNSNYDDILGLAHRDSNRLILRNPPLPDLEDLDSIPFPAWELFDLEKYQALRRKISRRGLSLPIVAQRGCPFHCTFCQKDYGGIVRKRSIDNVIEELKHNKKLFKITEFGIWDEVFTYYKSLNFYFFVT